LTGFEKRFESRKMNPDAASSGVRFETDIPLVLLHLSDIHFNFDSDGHYDVDLDLRRELESDVSRLLPELPGGVTAVVVSGDIADSGRQEEYEIAKTWLDGLCELVGCDSQNVFVVPGNHDVHRPDTEVGMNTLLRQKLRTCKPEEIDRILKRYLPSNDTFLQPLSAFNAFAARYGCSIRPDKLYWDREFPLNDGSSLRLRGMTTTLVSDASDDRESGRQILGTVQCQVEGAPGVVNVVMAHHPPEWLRDEDTVLDHVNNRTALQLYGHKHKQRVYKRDNSVIVTAGAIHPDRGEASWEPCFNMIALRVAGTGEERQLEITVESRAWRSNSTRFEQDRLEEFSIDLPQWTASQQGAPVNCRPSSSGPPTKESMGQLAMPLQGDLYRRLVWGFHSPGIGFATRMDILSALHLVADEDQDVPTLEIFQRAFERASDRRQLGALWKLVNQELGGALGENPFSGEGR
jgi:predicted phosphodiesterase